jgi:formate dehydrogenase subunit gamma
MVVAFFLLGAKMWSDNRMEPRDREWLKHFREVAEDREENVPEVGRYNAGQKLIFWLIVVCLPVLFLSGIVIWRSYFAEYFPIEALRFAGLLHAFFAFVLILAIVIHIYAAIWVRGSVRAITRGTVSYGWAWKHHRLWFRDAIKGNAPPK